jgi:uncharacterized membrane protein (DUF4010 family)
MTASQVLPFVYSLAIGLLIGFERERSHRDGPRLAAGSRTFALLALVGTLAASFGRWTIVSGMIMVAALLVVSYLRTNEEDPGTTTEVAAMATYLLGALAYSKAPLAAGLAIATALLLVGKMRIHAFARDVVTDTEVEDALKFLVIAFVVLPLLPDRNLGPYGVLNPAHIWFIVVALTGISWIGYIAVRALGPRRGILVTGLAGGFVSATATTVSMGRLSRTSKSFPSAVAGAQMASIATLILLEAIVGVVNRGVASNLWPPLLAGAVLLSVIAWFGFRRIRSESPDVSTHDDRPGGRPFTILPALVLAGVLTVALLVARWGAATIGPKGAVLAAGATGLADAHAGGLAATTLYQQGHLGLPACLIAIGAGLATNTAVKCILAFGSGGPRFGWRFSVGVVPAFVVVCLGLAWTASTA